MPFRFLEMKLEVGFDSIELNEPALGKAPEGFDVADIRA